MTRFIRVGGATIILAVFAIFAFILSQVVPLFRGAEASPNGCWTIPPAHYVALDADENGNLPFLLTDKGQLFFVQGETGEHFTRDLALAPGERLSAISYHPVGKRIVAGTDRGRVLEFQVRYSFSTNTAAVRAAVEIIQAGTYTVGPADARVLAADLNGSAERRLCIFSLAVSNETLAGAILLQKKRSLVGNDKWLLAKQWDLTSQFTAPPVRYMVNGRGDSALAVRPDGKLSYLELTGHDLKISQQFFPFGADHTRRAVFADYLLGNDSFVAAAPDGTIVGFSLFKHGESGRRWGLTKRFPPLYSPPRTYSASHRNKSFLVGSEGHISLRHFTTQSIRWEREWPRPILLVALGEKHNMFWVLDEGHVLHRFKLRDPHPEAGLSAFFGKIWYEGGSEPEFAWQSTGGTDEFEPKLSMVPLIIGTLKGTVYAMVFSAPLALLAALYVSQFAHPNFRRLVKPTIELMASLPSVILGFLAALWLAPAIEQRVPSVMLVFVALPLSALTLGAIWTRCPERIRRAVPMGFEFLLLTPFLVLAAWAAWKCGPWLERVLFLARDEQTGGTISDFRLWWMQTFHLPFEQRNSLVVGLIMGFAVIPIIFTIAEDALSNVPAAMRSASLALGATRWQTAMRIVWPAASPGIFSALMVGFGRAVGETMIVLMATGNTPITGMNIFSGMRTLAANIAVELPEAPHHGTLYRTLFFGALLLFLMTFVVNTVAEWLRGRIREKYKMA